MEGHRTESGKTCEGMTRCTRENILLQPVVLTLIAGMRAICEGTLRRQNLDPCRGSIIVLFFYCMI